MRFLRGNLDLLIMFVAFILILKSSGAYLTEVSADHGGLLLFTWNGKNITTLKLWRLIETPALAIGLVLFFDILRSGLKNSAIYRIIKPNSNSERYDLYTFGLSILAIKTNLKIIFSLGLVILYDFVSKSLPNLHWYSQISQGAAPIVALILFILVYTFLDYWEHRILHFDLFWPLHRLHHSATKLNYITSYRKHPAKELLQPLLRIPLFFIFDLPPSVLYLFFAINGFYRLIIHSERSSQWGFFGNWILLSPDHHRLHHSMNPEHFQKNLGTIALWDRIYGTYHDPIAIDSFSIGTEDSKDFEKSSFATVLWKDFYEFILGIKKMLFKLKA